MFEMKLPKMDATSSTFVPAFTYSVSEPTVTITNLPITDPRIPTLVESISQQQASNLDSSGGHSSLRSPQAHLGDQDCESNQEQPLYLNAHSPATGLSQLQINSPQALSPNPSALLSSSPQRTVSPVLPPNCPPSSPYIPTSPNMQRNQLNQQENQQALNEQNINDFIKSILAPDSPGLSDLGSNIFFDGSTRSSGTVCSDSAAVSEAAAAAHEEKCEDSKEGDETKEEESKEWLHSEKEDITESLQKLDIAQ